MAAETVASRYNRDWLSLKDDRKVRGFDHQTSERRNREYVDPATGTTVTSTGDNSNGFTVTISPA
jgi:hypothetical protein